MNKEIIEAFAAEICRRYDDRLELDQRLGFSGDIARTLRAAEYDLVVSIAKQFNPRFDEQAFRRACGLAD